MQYRLGVLGFLALEEFREEMISIGNYGMMDQRAALTWVQTNGRAFGGNADRSIVWGGWADGAVSACYHVVSPGSQSMVAGAIMQSTGCTFNKLSAEASRSVSVETFLVPLLQVNCSALWAGTTTLLQCLRGSGVHFFMSMACDLDPWHSKA